MMGSRTWTNPITHDMQCVVTVEGESLGRLVFKTELRGYGERLQLYEYGVESLRTELRRIAAESEHLEIIPVDPTHTRRRRCVGAWAAIPDDVARGGLGRTDCANRGQRAMSEPRYDVVVSPSDGNAFSIIGQTRQALRRAGASPAECKEYTDAAMSGDYNHLLQVTMEWVDLQPTDYTEDA